MKVLLNEQGYIESYALEGELLDAVEAVSYTHLDVYKRQASAMAGATGTSGFAIVLNITNFNNYGVEDIRQLTNEVMETASQFAMRKGVVFA